MSHTCRNLSVQPALMSEGEQAIIISGKMPACSQLVLNATTNNDRRWLVLLEWVVNDASRSRCYIQIASDDGVERQEVLCLAELSHAIDFEGQVERDATVYVADDPSAKKFPHVLEVFGKNVAFTVRESGQGVRAAGRFGATELDFEVPIGREGQASGEIGSGSLRNVIVRGGAWIPPQHGAVSVVTTERPGVLVPSLGIWLEGWSDAPQPQESWTSGLTFENYPTKIHIDSLEANIDVCALRAASEANFLYRSCPRWIGWCVVSGDIGGLSVNTIGIFVCAGAPLSPIDNYLGRVNALAYQALDRMLPINASASSAHVLFGSREHIDLALENFPVRCIPPILRPITTIIERGGQAWRGVALALCCQVVGGEFDAASEWLVFAEILHTGALIVDDVHDDTPVRRGGPSCHETYGHATAINSGSLAYFLVQQIIERSTLHDWQRAAIYGEYIDLLRVAHIGQGIDHQLDVERLSNEPTDAELHDIRQQIHYCDLFKSGVPFRSYARIGGILGGGTEVQVSSLGRFFQCLGTAFQAVDDVINIIGRGSADPKRGEDLRRGKITLPVLLALSSIDGAHRARLCRAIKSAKNCGVGATRVANEICAMDALKSCRDTAFDEVASAYRDLQKTFSGSIGAHLIQELAACTLQRPY